MICASEQSVTVLADVYDAVTAEFAARGCYFLKGEELDRVRKTVIINGSVNAKIVGQSAHTIAQIAGVEVPKSTKILIGEVESVDPSEEMAHEKLSPVLGMYKAKTFDEAIAKAERLVADGGYGHTSSLYVNVNEKEKKNVAEKRAIGAKAASLVAQDDSIIIASGTTMAFLAREIKPVGHLTVITAAVPVTSILSQDANVDVIQLGGITRSSSVSVVGPFAEQMLGNFNCSKLFVGVDGIDLEFGLTTTNMLEAALNRVMMNAAQKVIVLADSSKFGRRGFSKICDLEAVDRIITDNGIQPLYLDRLRERGIEVIVVDA